MPLGEKVTRHFETLMCRIGLSDQGMELSWETPTNVLNQLRFLKDHLDEVLTSYVLEQLQASLIVPSSDKFYAPSDIYCNMDTVRFFEELQIQVRIIGHDTLIESGTCSVWSGKLE